MGGSGGIFGSPKQKASGAFKMTSQGANGERQSLERLNAIASGATPSIGQMQMGANVDMANQQALALAASQRGASNPMLAFRQAQMANQQMGLEGAQQAAIMGQQEKMQANQMLLAQAAAQRGVALNSATANQQADSTKRGQELSMISGLGQGAMLLSDETEKKNIQPKTYAMDEIENFLKVLKPSTYEYKDKEDGGGEKMGVMAQDLEKSAIGKTMVDTGADGKKRVDVNKAIGAMMAAMADMSKKVKKLEK